MAKYNLQISIDNKIIFIILVVFLIQMFLLFISLIKGIYKYFLISELDLLKRYGTNTWVIITGASSGQGKDFSLEFAKRGFNILMIGSKRTIQTQQDIKKLYPNVDTHVIFKDFRKAFESDFFDDIDKFIQDKKDQIAVLINNVGYRTAWKTYHEMPSNLISDTIATGTIVQSRLTQMVIPGFLTRKSKGFKSALINITAQCLHPNLLFGMATSNEISVPYLSVYEGANAFGFYQGNSIYKEYMNQFDILNITPGAVITENTTCLSGTIFNIDSLTFVKNIIKMIGNVHGHTCAHWGHAFSNYLINLVPFMKDKILENVGGTLSKNFMSNYEKNKIKYDLN
jgi:short-subunit dehydrogenase